MSQGDLADWAGIDRSWLSQIESGRSEPRVGHAVRIHEVLSEYLPSLTWDWLLKGDGEPPRSGLGTGAVTRYDVHQGEDETKRREALQAGAGLLAAAAIGDPLLAALARFDHLTDASMGTIVDGLEQTVADLGYHVTREPIGRMYLRVNGLLTTTEDLLGSRMPESYQRRLQSVAGWSACLLTGALNDLGDHAAARLNAVLAQEYGRLAGDDKLVGYAWLQQARVAEDAERFDVALRLAREGLRVVPERTGVAVRLGATDAVVSARLGLPDAAGAVDRIRAAFEGLPQQEIGEASFTFNAAGVDQAVGNALTWQGRLEEAERHSMAAVHQLIGGQRPSRLASAQLDLAHILVRLGWPDEAVVYAMYALESERVVASVLLRADIVGAALSERYPGLSEARDFRERRAALALPAHPA